MGTLECIVMAVVGILLLLLGLKMISVANKRKKDCTEVVKAEIYEVTKDSSDEENDWYIPKIRYTVNNVEYTSKLDSMTREPEIGTLVDIKINPNNPSEIIKGNSNTIFGVICTGAGILMIVIVAVQLLLQF